MAFFDTTTHGHTFTIDTMDWHNTADAEDCAALIADQVEAWPADKAARIHSLLMQYRNGEIEYDAADLADVRRMCADCADSVMISYQNTSTMYGHNFELSAKEAI